MLMDSPPPFRSLDITLIQATVDRLASRIEARFPTRNLTAVGQELSRLARETQDNIERQGRSTIIARIVAVVVCAVLVSAAVLALILLLRSAENGLTLLDWPAFFESIINDLVFAGIAIYFVWLWPERMRQKATLEALHELRSLAHVIDMHQLTKDPERLRPGFEPTKASFTEDLSAAELSYYFDYCSELLSCVGKVAAAYAEHASDGKILDTVEGIEDLTTSMSRKIWQKIALLPQNKGSVG